jgi:hypothetical protein
VPFFHRLSLLNQCCGLLAAQVKQFIDEKDEHSGDGTISYMDCQALKQKSHSNSLDSEPEGVVR